MTDKIKKVVTAAGATLKKKDSMRTDVGVWIDHRKTVIATIAGKSEKLQQLTSNMESHVRFSGAAQDNTAEDQRDRRFTGHLNKYYDEVIARLRGADSILILGPGEAKGELQARLEDKGLGKLVTSIETVDKMTDHQIAARVREHFLKGKGKARKIAP